MLIREASSHNVFAWFDYLVVCRRDGYTINPNMLADIAEESQGKRLNAYQHKKVLAGQKEQHSGGKKHILDLLSMEIDDAKGGKS